MVKKARVAIVDYRAGNLRSVAKALEAAGAETLVTSDVRDIEAADALVFPGQGANDSSMRALKERGLVDSITGFIAADRPFLGVCLGLQLLMDSSDEGVEAGLGIIPGRTRKLPAGQKIPHMGWNSVDIRGDHEVLAGVADGTHFYFVHSYYADPADPEMVAGTTDYGVKFCSAVARRALVAVQFHPEKSGDVGLDLYRRFIDFAGSH
jgi:imidazole glycerol-phosphate synthase subunit HisH